MTTDLLVNVAAGETRVALLENGILSELYYERYRELGIVGNIYMGRVVKVLPGMDAAFVDIGLEKAAFLYISDVQQPGAAGAEWREDEEEGYALPTAGVLEESGGTPGIVGLLSENQELLVRVSREPIGTKGARITMYYSLPGRYLVLLPTVEHIGISRKIEDEVERQRLRTLVGDLKPEGMGLIVRTAAEGRDRGVLEQDLTFLTKLWQTIQETQRQCRAPSLVYQDLRLPERLMRDLAAGDIDRVVVDESSTYERLRDFAATFFAERDCPVERYRGTQPLFQAYDIEMEINRLLDHKVWLRSGGYIVIESTEALTAIDVNTGRFVGKRNLEDTILKTNLEAAKEIAFQLRLRNIGGIIIIDFIDMETLENRDRVFHAFEEALKRDKAKAKALKISELGMVEMTRERTRKNLSRFLCEPCPYCEGRGVVKSLATVGYEIMRELRGYQYIAEVREIVVEASPEVADYLCDAEALAFDRLESDLGRKITIRTRESLHREEYTVTGQ
ncbi:MAG: Rne/Rng family ribonuclease [Deltaproteobacteria bacterium]|nr:Rne/Rng family ribonuclease [Candidatus Anaeroferrophillacea bacterium]